MWASSFLPCSLHTRHTVQQANWWKVNLEWRMLNKSHWTIRMITWSWRWRWRCSSGDIIAQCSFPVRLFDFCRWWQALFVNQAVKPIASNFNCCLHDRCGHSNHISTPPVIHKRHRSPPSPLPNTFCLMLHALCSSRILMKCCITTGDNWYHSYHSTLNSVAVRNRHHHRHHHLQPT